MYHYLYKVANLVNQKYYIGIHSTDNLDDGYLGSGVAIKEAIAKYNSKNFVKEILEFFDSRESALLKEEYVVTEQVVSDENSYNLTTGGNAPPIKTNFSHTTESKEKISKYLNENLDKCRANGKKSWEVIKSKGGWSDEEISKRVKTRKEQNSYNRDMKEANTESSIRKRVETRKKNDSYNKDISYLYSEDIIFKRTKTRILNQMKKGQTFNRSVLEKYNIT
jgi:hypothetical protein